MNSVCKLNELFSQTDSTYAHNSGGSDSDLTFRSVQPRDNDDSTLHSNRKLDLSSLNSILDITNPFTEDDDGYLEDDESESLQHSPGVVSDIELTTYDNEDNMWPGSINRIMARARSRSITRSLRKLSAVSSDSESLDKPMKRTRFLDVPWKNEAQSKSKSKHGRKKFQRTMMDR